MSLLQYCRDCFRDLPESEWKPSYWGDTTKTCRRCTADYKRATRDPEYAAQRKALKASIRRAIRQEKEELQREISAVRKEFRRSRSIKADPEYMKFRRCCRDLKLDPDVMWPLYQAHDKRCEICGTHEDDLPTRLCMDHDHTTGEFRGWLCKPCNSGIGHLGDSADRVASALKYLEQHHRQP